MAKREISNLDLKVKLMKEYLENGGVEKIYFPEMLEDLMKVKTDANGKVDPDTVSPLVNSMMLAMLGSHLSPPPFHPEHMTEFQSTLQKANSFDQENLDTPEQFDKVYDEFKKKTDTLFRGQREAKWRLYSKLQRQWILEKLFEKGTSYQKLIENLVETGRTECADAIKKLLAAHHIDSDNPVSVLGYLQHHGCPTPLLDWTYKFQNALYFALDGLTPNPGTIEIEDYCSVYYIEEKHFEGGNLRLLIEETLTNVEQPLLQKMIEVIANGDEGKKKEMTEKFSGRQLLDRKKVTGSGLISHMTKIEHLIGFPIAYFSDKDVESEILFSLNNSKNILNQEGVFTWNADSSKPLEMVGDEQFAEGKTEEEAKNYRFCTCFNIHKKLADHARKRLEADGITKEYIYPTPDVNTWEIYEKCKTK